MSLSPLVIEKLVRDSLEEDIGHGHDVTSQSVIAPGTQASCVIAAREAGVVCGQPVALCAFGMLIPEAQVTFLAHDGDQVKAGSGLMEVRGDAIGILLAERTALNFLTHLSGIATLTRKYVDAVRGTGAKICDTRKTLPGLRAAQKYAVKTGGGHNHRFGLDDAILIKDNHIAAVGSVETALRLATKNSGHMVRLEIEVDTLTQLDEVLAYQEEHGGVDVVMLDNFSLADLEAAVKKVDGKILTEASGGVTLETVGDIAKTGVNYISVGALTHSAPSLDIGLDFKVG